MHFLLSVLTCLTTMLHNAICLYFRFQKMTPALLPFNKKHESLSGMNWSLKLLRFWENFFKKDWFLLCVSMVLYACECWCLWRPDEGVGFPWARVQVTVSCLLQVWGLCWGPPQEQYVRLTGTLSPAPEEWL